MIRELAKAQKGRAGSSGAARRSRYSALIGKRDQLLLVAHAKSTSPSIVQIVDPAILAEAGHFALTLTIFRFEAIGPEKSEATPR